MIAAWKDVFRGSWRYMLACPLLFAIPLAAEIAQHLAEIHIGMYASLAQAKAVESDPLRMGFGVLKVLSLLLTGYWMTRFLAFADGARQAAHWDGRAVRLYAGVLVWSLGWMAVDLWGGGVLRALGIAERPILWTGIAVFAASFVLETYLSVWKTGAALGNPALGFVRSIRMIHGQFWWSLALTLLVVVPLMVAHYALGLGAIGRRAALLWPMLALDALEVSFLGAAMVAGQFVIARRAAARAGVPLLPRSAALPGAADGNIVAAGGPA